jgi:S1-C subfamily serine protease
LLFSSRKWFCLSIVLIIGLTVSTSGLAILFLNLSKEHYGLQDRFNEISSQVEDLEVIVDKMKSNSISSETQGLNSQQIYELMEPSVVKITVKVMRNYGLIPYAQGSGFIYDASGFIITNYHVIEGAYSIDVTFLDGTIVEAELIGSDPYSDLAVIKIDPMQIELQYIK